MESNKFGFFWKLTMLVSTLIKYFLFLMSLICFVIFYLHDQSGELVEKGDYRFILLIIALLFLIAGLLIKIVEHQSVNAKLNNHPE